MTRALAYLEKTFCENLRDWKILSVSLAFGPGFIYLMWLYFGATAPAYRLLVLDREAPPDLSAGLVETWRQARHPDGQPIFEVSEVTELEAAAQRVARRDADLLVEIPADFSAQLRAPGSPPPRLVNHADQANPRGAMAMAMSDYLAFTYAYGVTGAAPPLDVALRPVGAARALSDFDLYVPALLVLALIMIMFTAAASLIREVDKGTMPRLMLSRLGAGELLAAVALNQVLLGVVALGLSYLAAVSVGYRSGGSLATLLLVGAVATLGVVAVGVMVAAWLRSIFELLTIGCFPFFVLMFFSECMFPLPKVRLLDLAGHSLYANDVLPTALCTRAFNKVLNLGAGPGEVAFELVLMGALSLIYLALGAWWFRRRHMALR